MAVDWDQIRENNRTAQAMADFDARAEKQIAADRAQYQISRAQRAPARAGRRRRLFREPGPTAPSPRMISCSGTRVDSYQGGEVARGPSRLVRPRRDAVPGSALPLVHGGGNRSDRGRITDATHMERRAHARSKSRGARL